MKGDQLMFVPLEEIYAAESDARCTACRAGCGLEVDGESWTVVPGHTLDCPTLSAERRARLAKEHKELMANLLHCGECNAVEHPAGVPMPADLVDGATNGG